MNDQKTLKYTGKEKRRLFGGQDLPPGCLITLNTEDADKLLEDLPDLFQATKGTKKGGDGA